MRTLAAIAFVAIALLVAASAEAGISSGNALAIDFTDATDARAKATWSDPDKLTVTAYGLEWDSEEAPSDDEWMQTIPLATGLSWRPPYGASVRVTIHPGPAELDLDCGQPSKPSAGSVYARYSPDLQHWSTWQVLQTAEPISAADKENPGRHFKGSIRIPNSERRPYQKLIREYGQLDVPWKSDEDAAVRWILEKDPGFFSRQLPFIGYVQFRYETGFYGGHLNITSFEAHVLFSISGVSSTPKDGVTTQDRNVMPWSFRADPTNTEPVSGHER